jgi:uncharacterized protein YndB with AHSA1/START domain
MNVAVAATAPTTHSLRIERLIAASPERMFAYWTEPELLAKWLAPGEMTCIGSDVDLQPGGAYFVTMREPNGRTVTARGIYLEIEPPRRLVFTWGSDDSDCSTGKAHDETEVEILLTAAPGGTKLVLTHTKFSTVESRDRHNMGWGMCIDKLERVAPQG